MANPQKEIIHYFYTWLKPSAIDRFQKHIPNKKQLSNEKINLLSHFMHCVLHFRN
jgi:hypothetical protein